MSYLLRYPLVGLVLLVASTGTSWAGTSQIKFAEPSWPAVNVKTEIITQLLHTLGYDTKTYHLSLAFIARGLAQGSVDLFLGYWLPADKNTFGELIKQNKIKDLGPNLSGAIEGLAVPAYTWKNGIHSVKDLTAHGDRFGHKIYSIGPGAALTQAFIKAVRNDYKGLGNWRVMATNTSTMLTAVKRATAQKEPIVFFGWQPHWMNIAFDLHYLKDEKGSPIASIPSHVDTLVADQFPQKHPNVTRLLRQLQVGTKTQSRWINQYRHGKNKESVARHWLANHENTVVKWLQGVKTASGESAVAAYRTKHAQ